VTIAVCCKQHSCALAVRCAQSRRAAMNDVTEPWKPTAQCISHGQVYEWQAVPTIGRREIQCFT
jgi:hypothetical protein